MDQFIKILIVLVPTLVSSITTFYITRYSCYKNRSLDKLEIAYNRIYYPIYRILNENKKAKLDEYKEMMLKIQSYTNKYEKYFCTSTLTIIKRILTIKNKKFLPLDISILRNDVYKNCLSLRRELGYLQPNIITSFLAETTSGKILIITNFFGVLIYIIALLCIIVSPNLENEFFLVLILMIFSYFVIIILLCIKAALCWLLSLLYFYQNK